MPYCAGGSSVTGYANVNFVNKKERLERERQELVDRKSKGRAESEARQEEIKLLWGVKEQDLKAETYKERKLKEQRLKAQKLREVLNSLRNLTADLSKREKRDLLDGVGELVDLATLQDREIEYLTQFRRELEQIRAHYPAELENLSTASLMAEMLPATHLLSKEKPKKAWERKRGGYRWAGAGVGLIEYEFGGGAEAELRKRMLRFPSAVGPYAPAYQPRCLDDILRGGVGEVKMMPSFFGQPPITVDTRTNMRRLQDLFGMNRNRFPKNLRPRRMGTQIVYDYRAVVEIMKALLKPSDRTRLARGAPRRLWLSGSALRARVLSGIEARLKNLSAPKHIQAAFLPVVRSHLPHSAKK